jgi:dihydroorotate dehydrogenase
MYTLLKQILFLFQAESAHHLTTSLYGVISKIPILNLLATAPFKFEHPNLKTNVFGLSFKNPVGLAAGFDKDGKYIKSFPKLGFGFYEIGTVTPRPQVGNPKPRLFRLTKDEALINRMGFNNDGVDALVDRLKKYDKPEGLIIGGNIGKNKTTPNESAVEDYLICFEKLYPYVDYFVVNVSSPNTPNLRALQEKGPLTEILKSLQDLNNSYERPKPILLKIAPDLSLEQIDDVIEVVQYTNMAGIVATNTTIDRSGLSTDESSVSAIGNGGLSGKILHERSTEVVSYIYKKTDGAIPIIAVGGIDSPSKAKAKFEAGASLVQVYTGLIYQGPTLIKQIKKHLI